jgi:hypothetical protein
LIDVLRPGETAPFTLRIAQDKLARPVASYVLRATATKTTDQPFLGIQFVQHDAELDIVERAGSSTLEIIGEVTNIEGVPASEVRIACAIYGEDGEILNVALTYAESDVIEPGETVPFRLHVPDVQGMPANYHILAYATRATDRQIERQAKILVQSALASKEPGGNWKLIGEVKNAGAYPAGLIQVAVSVYDASGQLLAVTSGFTWCDELEPEHRSPFELRLIDSPEGIDHWRLWSWGRQQEEITRNPLTLEGVSNIVTEENMASFSGKVRNTGEAAITDIEVGVTIYGPDAGIVAVRRAWLEGEIEPDAEVPFEIQVEAPPQASSYALYAQGEVIE